MKIIFARSPYSIIIDEPTQAETKLELYLWQSDGIEPTTPTYTFSGLIPSTSNRTMYYDIANQSLEYVENIFPEYLYSVEAPTMFAYAKVKRFYKTLFGGFVPTGVDETFIIVNGYTEYMDGANFYADVPVLPLACDIVMTTPTTFTYNNTLQNMQSVPSDISPIFQPYINAIIQPVAGTSYYINWNNSSQAFTNTLTLPNAVNIIKVPLDYTPSPFVDPYTVAIYSSVVAGVYDLVWYRTIVPECSPKYSPYLCSFINKYGGWENIWFLKANEKNVTTKSTEYNLSSQEFYYNPIKGQKQTFNTNGERTIKCNTGFVEEEIFSDMITQLLLSETILLNSLPVLVKTKSSTLKSHLKEKNINYEIEFEYKFQIINTII